MRVLVIEDNSDIATNIGDYLEDRDHVVDFAGDGVTGLHLAVVHDFDVIVLDLTLPGMDGLEVARKLRHEAHKQTPILMLTARDALEQKLTGFESGADDYMTKPFALQELSARLEVLARRGKGPQSRVLKVSDLTFNLDTLTVNREGKSIQLNPIGLKLLQALMEASPSVVTRQDLEQKRVGRGAAGQRLPARAHPWAPCGDRQAVRQAADPHAARHRLPHGRSGCSPGVSFVSAYRLSFALFGFGLSALFAFAALNIRARVEDQLVDLGLQDDVEGGQTCRSRASQRKPARVPNLIEAWSDQRPHPLQGAAGLAEPRHAACTTSTRTGDDGTHPSLQARGASEGRDHQLRPLRRLARRTGQAAAADQRHRRRLPVRPALARASACGCRARCSSRSAELASRLREFSQGGQGRAAGAAFCRRRSRRAGAGAGRIRRAAHLDGRARS